MATACCRSPSVAKHENFTSVHCEPSYSRHGNKTKFHHVKSQIWPAKEIPGLVPN